MAEYSREVLRVVVAQICQTIGWHSINSTPLEFMVDLMQEYFLRIYKLSHQYAEILGRTEVNLDDLGLAFQHMSIDLQQLSEYVRNVDSVPCAVPVPRFPLTRENHLNFLKPGSREVVTRQVHIHEHLPAMYPELEDIQIDEVPEHLENEPTTPGKSFPTPSLETSPSILSSPETIFKRPGDPLSDSPGMSKRTKINDESRALRELHSVMMTRAGFLSPAREGKLPESRTPDQSNPDSPTPSSYPMVPPELKTEKKPKKIVKKNLEDRKLDKENKKKNRDKDLFKPDKINEPKVKKLAGMKETAKLKALKPGGGKGSGPSPSTSPTFPINTAPQKDESRKVTKNISPKMKAEKITPPVPIKEEETFGKLPSEPDKQKLNIFKKISKARDDKSSDISLNDQIKYEDLRRRAVSPPILIVNLEAEKTPRADMETRREEKKIPHTPDVHMPIDADIVDLRSPSPDVYVFDDMSPPGTPSTPKTPELNVPGPALESKKKRKEKNSRKKDNIKSPSFKETPLKGKMMHDMMETEVLGRPKTPEALETPIHKEMNIPSALPFPFFPTFPTAPGLIPHPMFPRFPLPLGPRGAPNPHIPQIMHNLPLTPRFMPPPMKMDDFPVPKMKSLDQVPINIPEKISIVDDSPRVDIEKIGKANKIPKAEKCSVPPIVKAAAPKSDSFVPPQETPLQKLEKLERMDKKSKKHKIEKKEKLKKKKEKKDKHKEKPEKSKEKKEKIEKMKEKKEKKDKRKDKEEKEAEAVPKITLKLATASPRPPTPDNPLMKKITIKPLPKKPEGIIKRESSPELAKISPLVTRPPKQKTPKVKTESVSKKDESKDSEIRAALLEPPPSKIVDQKGHQVWICPACGSQDDGSPMIGCDDCDAWYHWVCVGMQVPPADKEDWYCRFCIAKKQELHHDKKKKKRKKKVKLPV